ncbi:MAG: hypothetical protein AAF770_02245 [Bacteroidota bacterium]
MLPWRYQTIFILLLIILRSGRVYPTGKADSIELPIKHQNVYRYESPDIPAMRYLLSHPFELESKNIQILETLLGALFAEFLLLQDIKSLNQSNQYPYLDDLIYSTKPACVRENSCHYRSLQFKNYAIVGLGSCLIGFFGNMRLIIALTASLLSWIVLDIAQVCGLHQVLVICIGATPLVLGWWVIVNLENHKKYQKKAKKIVSWLKKRQYWITGGITLFVALKYLIITFFRLNMRVKEHNRRYQSASHLGKESEDRLIGLQEKLYNLEKQAKQIDEKNGRLEESAKEKEHIITTNQQLLKTKQENIKKIEKAIDQISEIIKTKSEKKNRLATENQLLQKEIEQINNRLSDQKNKIHETKEEERKLKKQIKEAEKNIQKLKTLNLAYHKKFHTRSTPSNSSIVTTRSEGRISSGKQRRNSQLLLPLTEEDRIAEQGYPSLPKQKKLSFPLTTDE